LAAEITLSEQDAARVATGQRCRLKARALPYESLLGRVEQIAPAAVVSGSNTAAGVSAGTTTFAAVSIPGDSSAGAIPSTVVIRTRLDSPRTELRPGMSGYARVSTERHPVGRVALYRLLRFIRTEFWW